MTLRKYLKDHPEVPLWLLGLLGLAVLAILGLGYVVVYRIPDQDVRQKEIIGSIEKFETTFTTSLDKNSLDLAKVTSEQSTHFNENRKWRDGINDQVKTVHLIACEAARRRTGECARLIVLQSVQNITPQAAKTLASVSVTVTDTSKPVISSSAVADAIGVGTVDSAQIPSLASDYASMQSALGWLVGADASKFTLREGVIMVKFTNGQAVLTPKLWGQVSHSYKR